MEKTWRCTVCGYLHKGENPPDICPVCGVDASKFELVAETPSQAAEPTTWRATLTQKGMDLFNEIQASFVPHAVAAHFPNALLPTGFLFLLLTAVSSENSFEATSYHLLFVAFLAIPATIATGLVAWKKKFSGELAPIFRKKILLSVVLFVLAILSTGWRWYHPEVFTSGGVSAWVYFLLIAAILGCVTLLGHYGGQLVFGRQQR